MVFTTSHPCSKPPSDTDMIFLSSLANSIPKRAAAILAAAIHAVWSLNTKTEIQPQQYLSDPHDHLRAQSQDQVLSPDEQHPQHISRIAYDGSVIQFYPHFKDSCQAYIDTLLSRSGYEGALVLECASESSLLGAAVAVACVDNNTEDA
jgi:hexokinase